MTKRIVSMLLALLMLVSVFPAQAFAAEGDVIRVTVAATTRDNKPLSGVELELLTYGNGVSSTKVGVGTTGDDGTFVVELPKSGVQYGDKLDCSPSGSSNYNFAFTDANANKSAKVRVISDRSADITLGDNVHDVAIITNAVKSSGDSHLTFTIYLVSTKGDIVGHSVNFNANAGSDEVTDMPANLGPVYNNTGAQEYTIPDVTPTRDYAAFTGWNTAADGTGEEYLPGAYDITGAVNLYAQWKGDDVTVSFDTDGKGNETPDPITVEYGKAYGKLPTLTDDEYVFNGWQLEDGTEVTASTIVSDGEAHTLRAVWGETAKININFEVYLWDHQKYLESEYTEGGVTKYDYNAARTDIPVQDLQFDLQVYSSDYSDTQNNHHHKKEIGTTGATDENGKVSISFKTSELAALYGMTDGWIIDCGPVTTDNAWHDAESKAEGVTYDWDWEVKGKGVQGVRSIVIPDEFKSLIEKSKGNDNDVPVLLKGAMNSGFDFTFICYVTPSITVSFDSDGGSAVAAQHFRPASLVEPQFATEPTTTKEGKTFAGWYLQNADGTETRYDFNTPLSKSIALKAHWTDKLYYITWNLEGQKPLVQEYGYDDIVTAPYTEKDGFTFNGWVSQTEGVTEVPERMPAKDLEFTGSWSVKQYTITFVDEDGSEIDKITQDYGSAVTAPQEPTKEGFDFDGWDKEIPATMPAEDMTITAKWKVKSSTITFNTDGGTKIDPITQEYGAAVPAPQEPTKEGYTFNGWDKEIPATQPAEDMTITAKWTPIEYTVSFDANDGVGSMNAMEFKYGETKNLTANAFERDGYAFTGWNTAADGSGTNYADKAEVSNLTTTDGDKITLYAQWMLNRFTVTFVVPDEEGGTTVHATENVEYGSDVPDVAEPTKAGNAQYTYTFSKWQDLENKLSAEGKVVQDVTLTALFTSKAVDYKIIWVVDGKTVQEDTVPYGENPVSKGVIAPNPAPKTGYTFAGWDKEIPATMPAEDVEINAQWRINSYDVIYKVDGAEVYRDTYDFGETVTIRDKYVKEGYTVSDWDVTADFSMPAEDVEINATTTVNSYNVIYKVDGNTVYTDAYDFGETVTVRDKYVKEGYTVSDWDVTDDFTMPAKDVEINATTQVNSYNVIYKVDGNTVYTDAYDFGETVTVRDKYVKEGYTVTDWDKTGTFTMPAEDVEINATTQVNSYNVIYKVDGNTVYTDAYDFGETVTVRDKYVKEGYTVSDWDVTDDFTMPAKDVEINATTQVNSYNVIYKVDGNTVYTDAYDFGETVTVRDKYVKEGYTVSDWDVTDDFTMPAKDVEINATTQVNSYNVIYKVDGNTVYTDAYDFGETVTVRDKYVKEGYTVSDWDVTDDFTMPAKDVEINATTTVNSYNVIYKVDGNTVYTDAYDFGETVTVRDKYVKEGYTVSDWDVTDDFTMPAKDVEINATTQVNSYNVIYKVDGNTVYTDAYDFGETVTVRDKYVKEGYTVSDWDVTADFSMPAKDVEINATTQVNQYTVIYKVDGAQVGETETYDFGETVTIRDKYVKEGYTVSDWSVTENFNMPARNVEIVATTEINKYTVTWIVDDSPYDSKIVEHGSDVPSVDNPTKPATAQFTYTFNKWQDLENKLSEGKVVCDVTLTALFDSSTNSYTVTFEAADGAAPVPAAQTVKYGEKATEPSENPASAYYNVFNGWKLNGSAYDFSAPVTGNITLVADLGHECYDELDNNSGEKVADGYCDGCGKCLHPVGENGYCADPDCEHSDNCTCHPDPTDGVRQIIIYTKYADGSVAANVPVQVMKNVKQNLGLDDHQTVGAPVTTDSEGKAVIDNTLLDEITLNQDVYANVTGGDFEWADLTVVRTATAGTQTKVWPDKGENDKSLWVTAPNGIGFDGELTLYVKDVAKYTITWVDGDGNTLETDTVTLNTVPTYDGATPTKTADAQYTYSFNGNWSPEVEAATKDATYVAQFDSNLRSYTITWVDEDGTELEKDENVPYGTTPEFNGDEPSKAATAEFTYTFDGWTPEVVDVVGDATYKATYTSATNTYTVTWVVDGSTYKTQTVEYGSEVPSVDDPTKPATAEFTYTFNKWQDLENKLSAEGKVVQDVTLTALFDSDTNIYPITFVDEDGTVLEEQKVKYGEIPVYGGETPTKASDAQYTYTFAGWNPEIVKVTGEATYTAKYDSELVKYTVTWSDGDGNTIKTDSVAYGEMPAYTGATPTKTADAQYTYTFTGWDPEIVAVTGDATYTAQFSSTTNSYTVTFTAPEGAAPVPAAQTVKYGEKATEPSEIPSSAYYNVFNGWKLDGSAYDFSAPVTGNITLVADLGHECYDDNKDGYCDGCRDCLHEKGDNGFCSEPDCEHNADCDCHPDPTKGIREITIYTKFADGSVASNVPVQLMINKNKNNGLADHVTLGDVYITDSEGKVVITNEDDIECVLNAIAYGQTLYCNVAGTDYRFASMDVVRLAKAGTHTAQIKDGDGNQYLWIVAPEGIGFNGEFTLYVEESDGTPAQGIVHFEVYLTDKVTPISGMTMEVMAYPKEGKGAVMTKIGSVVTDENGKATFVIDDIAAFTEYALTAGTIIDCNPTGGYVWDDEMVANGEARKISDTETMIGIELGNNINDVAKLLSSGIRNGFEFTFICYLKDTNPTTVPSTETSATSTESTTSSTESTTSSTESTTSSTESTTSSTESTTSSTESTTSSTESTTSSTESTTSSTESTTSSTESTTSSTETSATSTETSATSAPTSAPTRPTSRPTTVPSRVTTTSTTTTTTAAPTTTTTTANRLEGDDRYETGTEISGEGWDKADVVILASGENYPDALAGVPLSKKLDAPILLTAKASLTPATLAEIQRLGATKVIILGGTAAVSQKVEDTLKGYVSVSRIWGDNRNGTAEAIAYELTNKSEIAFIVSNATFADALSASSPAAIMGAPILYANPDGSLPKETVNALKTLGCTDAYIVGGTAAVAKSAESNLKALGIDSERVYGNDRYLTSIAVYNRFKSVFTSDDVAIATGKDFPDALTGAALAAKMSMPVFLVGDSAPAILVNTIKAMNVDSFFVMGGEKAVPQSIIDSLTK